MKLYLVQHAKAVSKQIDPERPITEEGRRDISQVAAFIKPLNLSIDYLWHSGKKRALQTAEILAEVVKVNETQIAHEGLGPNDDVSALGSALASMQEDIMIVGHLPFLSKLASLLLTGDETAEVVAFKNAGIVCLERCDENQWRIDWIVNPEILV